MENQLIEQFVSFCEHYLQNVYLALDLLNAKSKEEPSFQIKKRTGYLGKEEDNIRYTFHGIGCMVHFGIFMVDWDFVSDDQCGIIEPYFLRTYIKYFQDKFPLLEGVEQFIEICEYLVNQGRLTKVEWLGKKYCYRFIESNENDNPKRFNAHPLTDEETLAFY